jgi:Ca2+-binding RTX toxin-like protein
MILAEGSITLRRAMFKVAAPAVIALLVAVGADAAPNLGAAGCTITGTAKADTLRGTPHRDVICGLGGNDTLLGYAGNDRLVGGGGADLLDGGSGLDVLVGEAGNDYMVGGVGYDQYLGGPGADYIWSRDGSPDVLNGGLGVDNARIDQLFDRLTSVESS